MTFGEKLNHMRKKAGFTQEEVSHRLGISPQAVSKWENDLSCPDIMLLPEIAKLYGISVDALLGDDDLSKTEETAAEKKQPEQSAPKTDIKKNLNNSNSFVKVKVLSQFGDNVNVKLPVSLLKSLKGVLGNIKFNNSVTGGIDLSGLDIDMIFDLVESGAIGEIVDITTQNGDIIKVCVEQESV